MKQTKKSEDVKAAGIGDLIKSNRDNKNIVDKIFESIVDQLFSEKNILMMARLRSEDFADIVRINILIDFFIGYYERCKVTFYITQTATYPWYIVDPKEVRPKTRLVMKSTLTNLMNKYLKLTCSLNGEGRKEAKDIAEGAREKMDRAEQLKAMMPRIGGA